MDVATELAGGISCRPTASGTLLTLWGDIDASLRSQANSVLEEVYDRTGSILVDAAAVSFIDSSGLAFLLEIYRCGRDQRREIVLRDPSHDVEDMLAMIGMAGRIPVFRTEVPRRLSA